MPRMINLSHSTNIQKAATPVLFPTTEVPPCTDELWSWLLLNMASKSGNLNVIGKKKWHDRCSDSEAAGSTI